MTRIENSPNAINNHMPMMKASCHNGMHWLKKDRLYQIYLPRTPTFNPYMWGELKQVLKFMVTLQPHLVMSLMMRSKHKSE